MRSIEEKMSYEVLESQYESAYERIKDLEENERIWGKEIHYLYSFISWKHLSEEFEYFRENAQEVYDDDLPFPTLTL